MPRSLAGNRLVLIGAVLHLLEWVAIMVGGVGVPLGAAATDHDLSNAYAGHADALAWAVGWFCVVELGRVILMVGLRSALAEPGRDNTLMDVAVVAMAVSVALEVVVYAVAAGAAWALDQGGSLATTRALDASAFITNQTLYGPLGVSVLCAAIAMWRSGLFARALCALGVLGGSVFTVLALGLVGPRFTGIADAASAAALPMWIWMVWTGVVVWRARRTSVERRTGRRENLRPETPLTVRQEGSSSSMQAK
jgi:hypothetical protein